MNNLGISTNTLIPLRIDPKESSEMVSQVILGETYSIVENMDNWIKIKLHSDNYSGWIDKKLYTPLESDAFESMKLKKQIITKTPLQFAIRADNGQSMPVIAGSKFQNNDKDSFEINNQQFEISDKSNIYENIKEEVIHYAKSFINAPYLWGGKSILGIDCSGLTQICYNLVNIQMPRDASQQITKGNTINFIQEIEPADLAFFSNTEGYITHVGIVLNKKQIIHASGKVRIDQIDQQGIFNNETKQYTHQLRTIKRIIKL